MAADPNFIPQEILKAVCSLIVGIILLFIGKGFLDRRDRKHQAIEKERDRERQETEKERDRKRQDIEKERIKLNDLRKEVVQIFNQYYKVRKRYTTVRESLIGKRK